MRGLRLKSSSLLLAASLLISMAALEAVQAQSGRRAPKASGSTAPPAPTQPEPPPPSQPKIPAQPQTSLLVMSDISQSLYLSVPFPERAQAWLMKRLRESSQLSVMGGERANRSDAVKRAKASTEAFVIFLKVDESGFSPSVSGRGRVSGNDVVISYSVLSPGTGKARSSGAVYLSQISTGISIGRGGASIPVCYPSVRGDEHKMLLACLEIAERIMYELGVKAPPVCSATGG